nr:hypothetical protein [Tanacetum cinerariifolium]
MKGWKSGFFLIDQRAIPHYMSWRHPDSVISDLKPLAGSYSQVDVRRLSAFIVKLRDMPEGVLVLSGLSRVWKSCTRDLILKDSSGNVMGIYDFFACPNRLDRRFQKKFILMRGPLLEASFLLYSSSCQLPSVRDQQQLIPSKALPDPTYDDDASVEIPLITPIHSTATIPARGNQSRVFVPFAAESHGKAIMDDTVDTPARNFFPLATGPYYAAYLKDDVVTGSYKVSREEWEGPHQPTLSILTKEMFKDPNVADLNDKVTTSDAAFIKAKAKRKEKKKNIKSLSKTLDQFTSKATRFAYDLNQKFLASDEFSRVQGVLLSLATSVGFERGLNMDQTLEQLAAALKKISCFVDGAVVRMIEATPLVAMTDYPFLNKIADHSASSLSVLVKLELDRLAHPATIPAPRVVGVFLLRKRSAFASSGSLDVVVAISIENEKDCAPPVHRMFPLLLWLMLEKLLMPLPGLSLVLCFLFLLNPPLYLLMIA